MRVEKGDVIGTKDGRYGTVLKVDKGLIFVAEATHPDDDCEDVVHEFVTDLENVASIV